MVRLPIHLSFCLSSSIKYAVGVGAADITKLKANGYYTIAVWILSANYSNDVVQGG